jgi:hypothetical protein
MCPILLMFIFGTVQGQVRGFVEESPDGFDHPLTTGKTKFFL